MELKSGPVKYYHKKSRFKNNKAHKPALWGWGVIDPFGSNVRVNIMLQKGDLRSPQASILYSSSLSVSSFKKTLLVAKIHDPWRTNTQKFNETNQ